MVERWEKWYKLMLWKAYFNRGYGETSALKWFLALIGLSKSIVDKDVSFIFLWGFVYAVCCVILGKLMYRYGLVDAEAEVGNRINPLAREIREAIGKEKFK